MKTFLKQALTKMLVRKTRLYWKYDENWKRIPTVSGSDSIQSLVPVSSATSHSVELEFQSFPYGSSSITIPIAAPRGASIDFYANGSSVKSLFVSHDLVRIDITSTGKNSSPVKGELIVSTTAKSKDIVVLDGDTACTHVSIQTDYSLVLLLNLLCFIALLFTPLAIITAMGTASGVRAFGVRPEFTGLAAPICALLGIPKWPLPVLPFMIRKFHGESRFFWRILGFVLTVVGIVLAYPIVGSLAMQYEFNKLVDVALESYERPTVDDTLTDAQLAPFLYAPWRIEGKIIVEKYLYNARKNGSSLRPYWRTVRELLQKESIAARIEKLQIDDERPQRQNEFQGDPIVWFASILPEAESHTETAFAQEAIALLRSRLPNNLEAELYLYWLLYECQSVSAVKPEVREKTRMSLISLVDVAAKDPFAVQSIAYQLACDALGLNEILEGRIDEGLAHWDNLLTARGNALVGKSVPWLRPREKSVCFHAFMLENQVGREVPEMLRAELKKKNIYDSFLTKFKSKFPASSDYKVWYSQMHWQLGTWADEEIIGPNFSAYVRGLKDKGWD